MPRNTLLDFLEDYSRQDAVYLVHDDGYRTRQATYRDVGESAHRFAATLKAAGFAPDDKLVIWSENRAEWIVALWGCLAAGVVIVPVDYRASPDLVRRVCAIVNAKWVLIGEEVERPSDVTGEVRTISEAVALYDADRRSALAGRPTVTPVSLAEIIFTSGATAEPKGVTITHRNILANILPIEREMAKYRKVHPALPPDSVSEPASAQPHVRPVDGGVRAADVVGHGRVLARVQPRRDPPPDQVAPHIGARVCAEGARCSAIARRAPRAGDRRA